MPITVEGCLAAGHALGAREPAVHRAAQVPAAIRTISFSGMIGIDAKSTATIWSTVPQGSKMIMVDDGSIIETTAGAIRPSQSKHSPELRECSIKRNNPSPTATDGAWLSSQHGQHLRPPQPSALRVVVPEVQVVLQLAVPAERADDHLVLRPGAARLIPTATWT